MPLVRRNVGLKWEKFWKHIDTYQTFYCVFIILLILGYFMGFFSRPQKFIYQPRNTFAHNKEKLMERKFKIFDSSSNILLDEPWPDEWFNSYPNPDFVAKGNIKSANISISSKVLHDQPTETGPHYCMIVRTYAKQRSQLWSLLSSLHATKYEPLSIFLLDTDTNEIPWPEFSNMTQITESIFGRKFVFPLPFKNANFEAQIFPLLHRNDYGYILTDMALEYLMSNSTCDYITVTNGDNWYHPKLISTLLPYMRDGLDVIAFHAISHYDWGKDAAHVVVRPGKDTELLTQFKVAEIDLGCALFRMRTLKATGLLFALDKLRKDPSGRFVDDWSMADGKFFEEFTAYDFQELILNRILFFHQ